MSNESQIEQSRSLGFIPAPPGFTDDLEMLKQYQSFSGELLRLSLLGLTGISVIIFTVIKENNDLGNTPRYFIISSAILFGVSSAAALAHRYCSSDSLAFQLSILRRELRNRPGDESHPSDKDGAETEEKARKFMFRCATLSLLAGSAALGCGAVAFAAGIASAFLR